MIKAVIFDCFGVLTTSGFRVFRDKYFADDIEKRDQALELMSQQNLGTLSYKELIKRVAKLANVPEETVESYMDKNKPNEPLFDYIRSKLKPKYKIGLLSNAGDNWLKELFSEEDVKLFDEIILSYEVGLIKPDPNIYLLAAKKFNVEPAECIFIDDNHVHCSGAEGVGMKAICYKDFSQFKKDFEELL